MIGDNFWHSQNYTSFSSEHKWLDDYQKFLHLFGVFGQANELVELPTPQNVSVYAGWVLGKKTK